MYPGKGSRRLSVAFNSWWEPVPDFSLLTDAQKGFLSSKGLSPEELGGLPPAVLPAVGQVLTVTLAFVLSSDSWAPSSPPCPPVVFLPMLVVSVSDRSHMKDTGGSDGKEPACYAGDPGSVSGSGRSPGEGNGNPLQYSCLEHLMNRGAWWAMVHEVGVTES